MNIPRSEVALKIRPIAFRGGPLDGRTLEMPQIDSREWTIPTLDGTWVGDLKGRLPAERSSSDLRFEDYLRIGDEYVHETLVTLADDPPSGWLVRLAID